MGGFLQFRLMFLVLSLPYGRRFIVTKALYLKGFLNSPLSRGIFSGRRALVARGWCGAVAFHRGHQRPLGAACTLLLGFSAATGGTHHGFPS